MFVTDCKISCLLKQINLAKSAYLITLWPPVLAQCLVNYNILLLIFRKSAPCLLPLNLLVIR